MSKELLLEIGTEEMPARVIPATLAQLKAAAAAAFDGQHITYADWSVYGTPRRLVLLGKDVAEQQDDQVLEAKGPAQKIAYAADGTPTKAALGFARSQGVTAADLTVRDGYVYAQRRVHGRSTADLLPEILRGLVTGLSFPRSMRWGDLNVQFVRPIRWLVALFGSEVIKFTVGDVTADRVTRGHRFLGSQHVVLHDAADYLAAMADNYVMVDQDERQACINRQVREEAARCGGEAAIDPALLKEVTYLVEYPTVVSGRFDATFLALPAAAVITPMRDHQRYFPVIGPDGGLLPFFITVRNGNEAFLANVRQGNERVLRARLADAQFFFHEDLKVPLAGRLDKLRSIVFQEGLGTLYDKAQRLVSLAEHIAGTLHVSPAETATAKRAALLAKADLATNMVYEFAELQGVMGREYARRDGEDPAVAQAIYEHYLPRHAGDALPATTAGRIVSIADKIDNIVATFSRGLIPTGSQDPFALRRQALGVVATLLDGGYHLSLSRLCTTDLALLPQQDVSSTVVASIADFFRQRLKNVFTERGIRYDIADAVLAADSDDIYDAYLRATALAEAADKPFFSALVQTLTRVANLARQGGQQPGEVAPALFTEAQERHLYDMFQAVDKTATASMVQSDYAGALAALAQLEKPVDEFFTAVMVMVDDARIRANRLALLRKIKTLAGSIADFSLLTNT